jgi:hypothetical protein
MKILIISLPRTGSSNLLFSLANEKNLKPVIEPFNSNIWNKENNHVNRIYHSNDDNVIVKTIIFQHPDNLSLSKEFDEVILLSRKNLTDCAESWSYLEYKKKQNGFEFNQPYFWEKTPNYIEELENIIKWNKELTFISNELNIPITYYEDLYDVNDKNRLRKGNIPTNKTLI